MHNLRNIKHAKFPVDGANLSATAWDVTDDSLILAFGPTQDNPSITLRRLPNEAESSTEAVAIASWDAPSPNPDLPVDRILNLHYFPDTKTISLVLAGGDIIIVRESPEAGEDLIEIVGSVDAGVMAAAWSPDEELLAISTDARTLLLMTRAFESAADFSYSPEDVQVSNQVSVGWGKKETQFKGRGVAKTLRDPTVPEHVDEGTIHRNDDGQVSISWRGDGQFLAINNILEVAQRRRVIRVFSRDGVLKGVSEPVDGLDAALTWKPSGQIITGLQRKEDSATVVFFERNGLRHGEFDLRLQSEDLDTFASTLGFSWNFDSSVLAVSMQDRVQLWTMSNYHYYLKQEIKFAHGTKIPSWTSWHPEKPLHLTCASNSSLRTLSYRFEVCRGSVTPPHDLGTIAVIDGQRLKVTPLRIANIPPPMAFDEIELPSNALDVAINESFNEIAVLHENAVSLWTYDYSSKPIRKASLKALVEFDPVNDKDVHARIAKWDHFFVRTDHDRVILREEVDAKMTGTQIDNGAIISPNAIASVNSLEDVWTALNGEQISCRLLENGNLLVQSAHQTRRINNCTSYIVIQSHLVFTTSQHLLKFIHLHDGELAVPADEPEKDERCRSIERGGRIITVIPSAYSLILQMPRGNLETIYPRALVLSGIRQSIRDRYYKKAFLTCRTHRVDMNILHDYMPEQFMQDVKLFMKQVKRTEYIDLFLTSLSEEDVSETMYRETLALIEPPEVDGALNNNVTGDQHRSSSKVNRICDVFLNVLRSHSEPRLQNIVTAHVCKNPPDLEAGLKLVSELRSQADETKLEEAVDHICFLADVNQLYDTALGLYDVQVALLVAQQAQKDPREYMPYLEALHEMQPLRMRFTIDNDLKRYEKALGHLHALDVFDDVKSYTEKHELYLTALDLYRYADIRLDELIHLYADYLASRNRFCEAGVAYDFISEYEAAYPAYRAANMWQECLASATLVPLPKNELCALARDLADSLEEAKDYKNAATIHLDYLNDTTSAALERAAKLLCRGYMFSDAMRQVILHDRPELVQSVIDPNLIDASAEMTEMLSEMKTQLGAQVPRLRELRQKKLDDPMAFLDGADGGEVDIPDDLSLAPTDASTTGGTFMTRYTNRSTGTLATNATRKTSKNRRREERKRARGKKGTVYEEEYLENSIRRLVERLNDTGGDVAQLAQSLMRRKMRERAVAVQTLTMEVFGMCESCMDEVFNTEPKQQDSEGADGLNGDEKRPWGGQGVLWDALKGQKREAPKLHKPDFIALTTRT